MRDPSIDLVERGLRAVRLATAALAVAAGLFLLFHVSVTASFRAALVLLAALEVLAFGRQVLSAGGWTRPVAALVIKLGILATAYVALSS